MKILCITFKIGQETPAGIVFEDIVKELVSLENYVVLLTSLNTAKIEVKNNFVIPANFSLPEKLHKSLTMVFKKALENFYWEIYSYLTKRKSIAKISPDVIMVLASAGTPEAINLGRRFSEYLKRPLYIHLVDPIPPPTHWGVYKPYRLSMPKTISKSVQRASLFSMNNLKMIQYQQKYFKFNILSKSFVLPDPVNGERQFFGAIDEKKIFTYLGTFYGIRNPVSLIKGFEYFLRLGYDAELHIVGNNAINLKGYVENIKTIDKIKLKPYTNNLDEIYKHSAVLIDVDVNFPGDVFSSSKLKRYLFMDRPVILITHTDSPSSLMLEEVNNSVFKTDHDINNISTSMIQAISFNYSKEIFDDRNKVIEVLQTKNAVGLVQSKLLQISKNKKPELNALLTEGDNIYSTSKEIVK